MIIVYNVPRKHTIDFVNGHHYQFIGDSLDDGSRRFHLQPARTLHRMNSTAEFPGLARKENFLVYRSKRILLIDSSISLAPAKDRQVIDLVIVSRNPRLYISSLNRSIIIRQVVFDASAAPGKMKYWKKDCDSLGIPYHDVTSKGAFVMNLP